MAQSAAPFKPVDLLLGRLLMTDALLQARGKSREVAVRLLGGLLDMQAAFLRCLWTASCLSTVGFWRTITQADAPPYGLPGSPHRAGA